MTVYSTTDVFPVEASPEDFFYDQVVGSGGKTSADAKIDLPLRRDVQVGHGKHLLLVVVDLDHSIYGRFRPPAIRFLCKTVRGERI